MENLTAAIGTKFNALPHNSFYTSVNGILRKEIAEPTDVPPYAVFHVISDTPEWTFTTFFEKARIQFNLYSKKNGSTEVEGLFTALKALYDWCELTIAGNVHLYMRRELARLSKDTENNVWVYNVDYEILMERN